MQNLVISLSSPSLLLWFLLSSPGAEGSRNSPCCWIKQEGMSPCSLHEGFRDDALGDACSENAISLLLDANLSPPHTQDSFIPHPPHFITCMTCSRHGILLPLPGASLPSAAIHLSKQEDVWLKFPFVLRQSRGDSVVLSEDKPHFCKWQAAVTRWCCSCSAP